MRRALFVFTAAIFFLAGSAFALTLKESIDVALRQNPSITAARQKAEPADARLAQAVGAFLPTIKLDGNYGKTYTQPSTVQFTTATTSGAVTQTLTFGTDAVSDTHGWTASLSQPIFAAALLPGYEIAKKSAALAREDHNRSILGTSFDVTRAYFGVLAAEKLVELSRESKQMAESHLTQVNKMVAAGAAPAADRLRSEVQAANSEVGLVRALNQLALARNAFNNALGRSIEEEVKLEAAAESDKVAIPLYSELIELALRNRPDWKQYIISKEISEENLRLTKTDYLPSVFLSGSTGNQVVEYPAYRSDVNSWRVTGAASWTLFDGLGRQNRIREAAANLEAQRALEEQVKRGIELEVRDAYFNLRSGLETIGSAKKAVASAEENNRVSAARFALGAGTNIEVLDAQVSLTQARINYLQAIYDVETAKAKINKVVGKEVL